MAADVNKFVTEPSEPKMEGEEEMKGHEEEGEEEELDLEAILKELEAEDEMEKHKSEKMASLEKELAEYRKAVQLLRGKLNEVNLLNAKLLYTNKIFRKEGLTTEQKVSVIENFDRASSVREVKMVYTVLVETLTSTAKAVKAVKSTKVVTEGFASKATPSTAPKATEVISENSVAKRLQQLAGLI
jgi:glycerol-3-phosphate cytidylyltransferase-like family protein